MESATAPFAMARQRDASDRCPSVAHAAPAAPLAKGLVHVAYIAPSRVARPHPAASQDGCETAGEATPALSVQPTLLGRLTVTTGMPIRQQNCWRRTRHEARHGGGSRAPVAEAQ